MRLSGNAVYFVAFGGSQPAVINNECLEVPFIERQIHK